MKFWIKSGTIAMALLVIFLTTSCKREPSTLDDPNNIQIDTTNHSESMDTGKSSDSIIRTNSADGTDSGL